VKEWVERKYSDIVQQKDIPALSVGIIYEGETLGFFNYGSQSRGSDIYVDEHSIFQIASLSKTLTGIATQKLINDGKLDMDMPLSTYLSSVLATPAQSTLRSVTFGQLLQHQSGIKNDDCYVYKTRVDGEVWLDGYTRRQLVDDINKIHLDESAEPKFDYSNCGYAIVGLIDEIATDKDYAAIVHNNVASKYGMTDTVVNLNEAQKKRLVVPYRKDARQVATGVYVMGYATPGSGVYSTVSDLLSLQVYQLRAYRKYAASGQRSELILTETTSPGPRPNFRFGTGMIEVQHPKGTFYLHDGDLDGFAGVYAFSPEHNIGVVAQTSSGGPWVPESAIETLVGLIDMEQTR